MAWMGYASLFQDVTHLANQIGKCYDFQIKRLKLATRFAIECKMNPIHKLNEYFHFRFTVPCNGLLQ